VELKVKAIRYGNSLRVAIPTPVCEVAGVKVKDTLLIDYDQKTRMITLRKEQP
jgi:bifunctional DNA-binding transcriptional regulator/antitoxin component of YhaV-PrlF toxin-antitoxin module